jgi:hypothetical protein
LPLRPARRFRLECRADCATIPGPRLRNVSERLAGCSHSRSDPGNHHRSYRSFAQHGGQSDGSDCCRTPTHVPGRSIKS